MKVLSAREMQACDRVTVDRFHVPSIDLMRNAARALATFAREQYPEAHRITILCGHGNNGGDGLMTAPMLATHGIAIKILLLGDPETLKGDALTAWREIAAHTQGTAPLISFQAATTPEDLPKHTHVLTTDLILDAILGTGFEPPLRGLPQAVLEWLEAQRSAMENPPPVLSVDLPSGCSADRTDPRPDSPFFPSDAVLTFTAPKPAHLFGQLTRSIRQPIVVASIGSPDEAVQSALNLYWAGTAKSITDLERPADSNKGMYGHVLVVGGSPGKSGAPAMASLAALRAGAGLVTAAVTPSVLPLVAAITPELMTRALATSPSGEISPDNLQEQSLKSLLDRISVLAIGPGLGSTPEAEEFVVQILTQSRIPAVVDADALNALAKHPGAIGSIAEGRTLVFTPHPGEMARLIGSDIKHVQAHRIEVARNFATKHQLHLVLKGWRTLVAHPDGSIGINTTGNPAMAKGGSGDLLTGIVAALLAQHPAQPAEAVEAAVYLHGLAADIAVQSPGVGGDQHTLLATDTLHFLHTAFLYHPVAKNGYCWVQGMNVSRSPVRDS